ncbi:TIGR04222 domain-containing membrane protein [Dactylosporangium sp. CA-139066]|uniref:TIGR04222 domain-containing membrane protein n=1 Tax=Dactylosporangium sp. CA-139066 TaxID=3239930 RepID=UPI003D8DF105
MDGGLKATEVAYLAGGERAAVRAGLIMLYRRGRLETDERGRVNRTGADPRDGEPFERALYNGLLGWIGPRELATLPRVRAALADLRTGLRRDGELRWPWVRVCVPAALLALPAWAVARFGAPPLVAMPVVLAGVVAAMWFIPRRTLAGMRRLQWLRSEHAGLAAAADLDPRRAGLAVALFGNAALLAVAPVLAVRGGLLDGGRWSRESRQSAGSYGHWTSTAMHHFGADGNYHP